MVHAVLTWPAGSGFRFACYAAVAALASGLKVRMPGVEVTLSVSFFFSLLSAVELGFSGTFAVAFVGGLTQSYWRPVNRPQPIQIVFNLSSLAISSAIAAVAFSWPWPGRLGFEFMSRVTLATTALFLANTLLVGLIVSLTQNKRLWPTLRSFSWSFSYYLAGAVVVSLFHAISTVAGWQSALLSLPAVYLVYRSYQVYLDRLEAHRKHAEQMSALHLRTIEALALAIEAKDETTHQHLGRVQVYALEVGKELGLDEPQTEALRAASLLHDIGKLAVPGHIINKPGKLTPEEFERMKIHPSVGAEILETVQFPYPVVPIVRGHHEKWDGAGYPDGLKGEDIPIGARIIAAVDCLDALASDRQYRRALPLDQAMEIVRKESGRAFDPRIVEILSNHYTDYERKAKEQTRHDLPKLSLDLKIGRGGAPAAGFEENAAASTTGMSPDESMACLAAERDKLRVLLAFIEEFGPSLGLEEIMAMVAIRLRGIIAYDGLAAYVVKDGALHPLYVTGEDSKLFSSLRIPVGEGLSGWVADNRRPMVNGNPSVESGYLRDPAKFSALGSAVSVPMVSGERVTGVLTLYAAARNAFSKSHAATLETLCSAIAAADCHRDHASSGGFVRLCQEVKRCQSVGLPMSVIVGDLQGFGSARSRFGEEACGRLLQSLTERLRMHSPGGEGYLDHLAGDEFAFVLPGVAPERTFEAAALLQDAVSEIGMLTFGEDLVSLSVGVSGQAPAMLDQKRAETVN